MSDERLRKEIAALAARLIAEDGLEFKPARMKAAQQVLAPGKTALEVLPGDDELLEAVREYQRLFQADTQPARLLHLRRIALQVMQMLPEFTLVLAGAAANGTAGETSDIYLQCEADSSKDLHIALLNLGIEADADELANPFGRGRVERLNFGLQGESVNITCYPPGKARQIGEQAGQRLDLQGLRAIVEAVPSEGMT